ncbi:vomeronasal type-2 receptor 26-like [Heteronotia binoei]|uniref:vomeronasal type-2 receptor 26-like n=1 Tax=Heteronotia binoei TaxID=13085 RepID=UPI00292F41BC|nr:vomeronasal type-2 receptor 26-like [Heteronotia binoei]
MVIKYYQHNLALAFAINEINENPKILPNITLGFHIYDSYFDVKMTYHTTLELLFKLRRFLPNYKCDIQKNVIAVLGGLDADISFHMADILGLYKIPQITYGSFVLKERDATEFPSFYRMVPNENQQYTGIIQLLIYFGWTWVGLLASDDDFGEHFLNNFEQLLFQSGICSAFTLKIVNQAKWDSWGDIINLVKDIYQPFEDIKVNVLILYGGPLTILSLNTLIFLGNPAYGGNVSLSKVWILTAQVDFMLSGAQRNWAFDVFHGAITFTIHSNEVLQFKKYLHDIKPYQEKQNGFIKELWEQAFDCSFPNLNGPMKVNDICSGDEKLESLPGLLFEVLMTGHSYSVYSAVYAIAYVLNTMITSNSMTGKSVRLQDLQPWQVKFPQDMVDCVKCPKDHYPSKDQVECIHKDITFLTFEEPLGISLALLAVSFSLITLLILATFIKHRDTPIVKANNRDITYVLLFSLLLCFLCSLLFLGEPSKVTCFIQQTAFGIIFSVAVSCVLAKTVTVITAFMATKPGPSMRKWMGKKLTNSVVLSCSLIQATICMVWLGTSPPFPDFDMESLTEEIIAECNEGSVVMFYIVLVYLGLLSIISLTVAFIARKLPDSFNESKFITFSMLIFCSVWMSFVPTYLSTKGKYMVAVEIFSILASSAGLLACIFFPKGYIIVFRPEQNNKECLIRRKKSTM